MSYIFWLSLGIVLAVSEFVVPGFVIIFFGAGAVITGIVKLICGDVLSDGFAILIFALSSVISLLAFRKTWVGGKVIRDGNTKSAGDVDETCVGHKVVVVEAIAPDCAGKVELNGANWTAESESAISAGAKAVVTERRGLTLVVKPC